MTHPTPTLNIGDRVEIGQLSLSARLWHRPIGTHT